MAMSSILKVCPSCKTEIQNPPPKKCPICQSPDAWKHYIAKEKEKIAGDLWAKSLFIRPTSISGQSDPTVRLEGFAEYENSFKLLNLKEKEALLTDALMIMRTLMISSHTIPEVARLLSIAERIIPLTDAYQKALKAGMICAKEGLPNE
jgi:RNA polymerase subunit RPABC4/transcription elongation factor Spt4